MHKQLLHHIYFWLSLMLLIAPPLAGNAFAQQDAEAERTAAQKKQVEVRLAYEREELARLDERNRMLQDTLAKTRNDLRHTSGHLDVSAVSLQNSAVKLDEQVESIRLELQGNEARSRALSDVIEQQSKRALARAEKDPVAIELQKLVDLRSVAADRVQAAYKAGAAPTAEVDAAAAALAEAKVRLAERRQTLGAQVGADALAVWNRELLDLTVTNAQQSAKLMFLESKRDKLLQCLPMLDELSRTEDEFKRVHAQLLDKRARVELLELEDRELTNSGK